MTGPGTPPIPEPLVPVPSLPPPPERQGNKAQEWSQDPTILKKEPVTGEGKTQQAQRVDGKVLPQVQRTDCPGKRDDE